MMNSFAITSVALLAILAVGTAEEGSSINVDKTPLTKEIKKCLQESTDQKKNDDNAKIRCVGHLLGTQPNLDAAKKMIDQLLNGNEKEVVDFFTAHRAEVVQFLEVRLAAEDFHAPMPLMPLKKLQQRRKKREERAWYPTPEEVQLAKRVKICMDMTGDNDATKCVEKILGKNHADVDVVRLATINNYDAVLEELKEFFEYQKQGGTLKDFNAYKRQQNAAKQRQ